MIHIWCDDEHARQRLAEAMPPELETAVSEGLHGVDGFQKGDCAVVGLTGSEFDRGIVLLQRLLQSCPTPPGPGTLPLVVVEAHAGQVQRLFGTICPHGRIGHNELALMLEDTILQEYARAALADAAWRIRHSKESHPVLRRALLMACRGDPPPSSVRDLARRVGRDETTLQHHYRCLVESTAAREAESGRAPLSEGSLSLRHLLDRFLLLSARARKTPRLTWGDVAREYSIDPERLHRSARRVAGGWPSCGTGGIWIGFASRFRDEVARAFPVDDR